MANLITSSITQNKAFYYKQPLTSEEFNRVFSKTLPLGIYEGGLFTRTGNTTFDIDPFSVVIEARNKAEYDVAVRIRIMNTLSASIINDIKYPLIIARYTWVAGSENELEILQVSEDIGTLDSQLNSTDLILGKLNLTESDNVVSILEDDINFVDYTQKNWSLFSKEVLKDNFLVRAAKASEDKTKVYIEYGTLRTKKGLLNLVGSSSPSFSNTTSARIDYLYIDEEGNILVEEGKSDGKALPYYGRKVIAEIRREPGRDSIYGSEIFCLNETPFGTLNADTFTVNDIDKYFSSLGKDANTTIENALKLTWEKTTREIIDESKAKTFRNINGLRVDSGDKKDSIILKPLNVGSSSRSVTVTTDTVLTANRFVTCPDGNVTLVAGTMLTLSDTDQTIDGVKTFKKIPQLTSGALDENENLVPLVAANDYDATPFKQTKAIAQDLDSHMKNSISTVNAVHGIKQGPNGRFNADMVDGAHLSTSVLLGGSDPNDLKIPSEKAVKSYVDTKEETIKTYMEANGTSLKAIQLKTARTLNGASFDGTKNITVPAQTSPDSTNSDRYLTFVDSSTEGNHSLKKSSNLKYNPGTGKLTFKTLYLTSSRTKKHAIKDYNKNASEIINSADIKEFIYNDDKSESVHIGIIAEDAPEVMTDKEKKTFALSDTVGVLLKAFQEQSLRISNLEERIKELEEK